MEGHTELLEQFVVFDLPEVPVWKNMLKLIGSSSIEESAAAGHCLGVLTKPGKQQELAWLARESWCRFFLKTHQSFLY